MVFFGVVNCQDPRLNPACLLRKNSVNFIEILLIMRIELYLNVSRAWICSTPSTAEPVIFMGHYITVM